MNKDELLGSLKKKGFSKPIIDAFNKARKFMIEDLKAKGIHDKNVLRAMEKIRRDIFVPKPYKESSYEDTALPLIKNQTISQPYTVAYMLQELELKKGLKVLEIGAGSGYNAALIAEIVKPGKLYTIEIVKELVKLAKNNLKKAKVTNVKLIEGDGSKGYEKEAKYDRIIFTASAPEIPKPLKNQLKDNGIILGPVGGDYGQSMIKCKKIKKEFDCINLGEFIFVPLKGQYGW